jgi:hypothetical protein
LPSHMLHADTFDPGAQNKIYSVSTWVLWRVLIH